MDGDQAAGTRSRCAETRWERSGRGPSERLPHDQRARIDVRAHPAECGALAPLLVADVVGPICESGDFFAKDREIARPRRGDLLAVMSAGAYGFTMASNYNSHPKPPEVLVDGDQYYVIRTRKTMDDLIRGETIPAALQ